MWSSGRGRLFLHNIKYATSNQLNFQGSKFIKIWRLRRPRAALGDEDLELTDVTELQILREHSECLTALAVDKGRIYSTCSDGRIFTHEFPMASEAPR